MNDTVSLKMNFYSKPSYSIDYYDTDSAEFVGPKLLCVLWWFNFPSLFFISTNAKLIFLLDAVRAFGSHLH